MLDMLDLRRNNCMDLREHLKDKKRIVIKIGSSSLTHPETGALESDEDGGAGPGDHRSSKSGKRRGAGLVRCRSPSEVRPPVFRKRPERTEEKQACAAIGQARLMMIYQKLFSEYNQSCAQILMTKSTVQNNLSRLNAYHTFEELVKAREWCPS